MNCDRDELMKRLKKQSEGGRKGATRRKGRKKATRPKN